MRAPNHLNALRAFEAVARHRSYVRAAEELNVTPAAVGNLVRSLEETLGTELFHRSAAGPARLELTAAAVAALPDLQAGFDRLTAGLNKLRPATARSTVVVTVPSAIADKWLLRRVERFLEAFPQIDLHVDTNNKLVDFNVDHVDVGIRYGGGHWAGLTATLLMRDEFFPVCGPALLQHAQPLRSADDLRHHALIHDMSMRAEASFPTWTSWLAAAGITNIESGRGLQINDSAAATQAAVVGRGVALGRTILVADDLASGALIRPFGSAQSHAFAYYVVCEPGRSNEPAIEAFVQWLLQEAVNAESAQEFGMPATTCS